MSRTRMCLVLGLALAVVAPVAAVEDEEKKVRRIEVRKTVDCVDGEDCDEQVSHRVVFVGDDGDVQVLEDGDHEWAAEDNVRILKAGDHDVDVIVIEDREDGEEVAESTRRRVHRVMKRLGERGLPLHRRHDGGAFLGVELSDLTPELRTHFGVPEDTGVMVGRLVDDSPAFRAGIEVGDIVTAVDGEPVASASALARAIRGREDGATAVLEVWRDGRMQKISATLEERKRRVEMSSAEAGEDEDRVRLIEVKVACEDGDDCTVDVGNAHAFAFAASACGDSGECDVNVDCTSGDCACTVNGEAADCSELGF